MKPILFTFFLFQGLILNAQNYTDYIGAGHTEGVVVTSSHQETENLGSIDGTGLNKDLIDASRFLSQATLGANLDYIRLVDSIGYENWLDRQFNMPRTSYTDILEPMDAFLYGLWLDAGRDSAEYSVRASQFRYAWSEAVVNRPDVLRHRITLALSEILVISTQSDLAEYGYGVTSYYDLLSEHAFGNYRDLLMDVTLHPCMGFYLSHLNNPRTIPDRNVHPDENYAREIMQLFTIGLYELNIDGSRTTDSLGNFIPTYDNDDIKELAKIFTGLGMGTWANPDITQQIRFGVPFNFIDPTVPMKMYEPWHEPGEKTLLGDFIIPNNQPGMNDIEMAVEHLFNHPNVGPFISNLLIKRLVKSNPSPDYIARIATVFNDNGSGVRGDLKSVTEAILLDPEARECNWIVDESNGRLKEPIQRYTQYVKAFNATSEAGVFWNLGSTFRFLTDQYTLHSPSVFNFFLPDYTPNGAFADEELSGPEFQILNSSTSLGYINFLYLMALIDNVNEVPYELALVDYGAQFEAYLDAPDLQILKNYPDALVDYLDLVLAHGNMTEATKRIIQASIEPLEEIERDYMLRLALYLTMMAPDYVIMK